MIKKMVYAQAMYTTLLYIVDIHWKYTSDIILISIWREELLSVIKNTKFLVMCIIKYCTHYNHIYYQPTSFK